MKRSIEGIQRYVEKFNPEVQSYNQLVVRSNKLSEFMNTFEQFQSDVELHSDVTDAMMNDRTIVEDNYYSTKALLQDLMDKYKPQVADLSNSNSQTVIRHTIKLPAITTPTFNGDIQKWVSSLDTFNAMFHNNPALAEVQKFHYLKSCLTDAAAEVVQTIPTTEENYGMAYNTLIERYENKSLIIQSHIRSLFATPHVQQPSASELRKLHHHIVSQVRALKALQQPVKMWDAWLVTLVCNRLDPVTVGEWQLIQKSKDLPRFNDIEKFLSSRVSAYEVGEIEKSTSNVMSKNSQNDGRGSTKKVLFVKPSNLKQFDKSRCVLCSDTHKLFSCNKFIGMSTQDRKGVIFNKLCYNCLSPGHQSSTCYGSSCKICGKKHNTMLHSNQVNHSSISNEQGTSKEQEPNVMYVKYNNQIKEEGTSQAMLATAIIYVGDVYGKLQPCRAVLDSGSQLNFISQACAKRLQLKYTNESISLAGIGSTSMRTTRLTPTIMSSRVKEYSVQIVFHSLSIIASSLPSQLINMKHLSIPKEVQPVLADSNFYKPGSVDCLLGAKIFFNLFHGKQIAITEHLIAHSTKL